MTTEEDIVPYAPMLRDMPEDERPRERLIRMGANVLSNAELLAIMIRVGVPGENVLRVSEQLLARFNGLPGIARATLTELCAINGIGPAKAVQVKAALELGRRLMASAPEERSRVTSPADAANLLMSEMMLLEQEDLRVMLLDTRNQVLRIQTVYKGSLNTSVVRVGEVFRSAIKDNAAAIIVAHNHPSGDPSPSPEDIHVTRQLAQAGKLLDIELLDHIIIGYQRYISLKEKGLGFD